MRYVFYVLGFVAIGLIWINTSSEGRKIRNSMEAVGERNAAAYRPE